MDTHGAWDNSVRILNSSRVNILISDSSNKLELTKALSWVNFLADNREYVYRQVLSAARALGALRRNYCSTTAFRPG
jgi:hypothetical protein